MAITIRTILILVFVFALKESGAQPGVNVFSQKFAAHEATLPKTKLHLVFNQDKFSPGDTMYFKAYFLTEDLTRLTGKQLIDVDLVNSAGESKLHIRLNVGNGLGQNQLALPDTLSAGIYLVTAYTGWMKNFDPAYIFRKQIAIVKKNTLITDEKPVMKAIAEGGHLIRDISNRVTVRTYRPGSTVQIVDEKAQEVVRGIADPNGVASLIFRPARNTAYFAVLAGETLRAPLPSTEDDGCGVLLTPSRNGEPVRILITSPPASALRDEELVLIVSARGKIFSTATFLLDTKDFVSIQILTSELPEGIAHASLLNHSGELIATRDFYNLQAEQTIAKLESGKPSYVAREKVRIELTLTDDEGQPLQGEFAISAVHAGLLEPEKQNSLSDELNIASNLKEKFIVDRTNPNWLNYVDNYLVSAPEEVPWDEILSGEPAKPRFGSTGVIQMMGTAYYGDTHQPVPDFTEVQFYLQRDKMRYQATTSGNGKIGLAIFDMFGTDEFFYMGQTLGKEIPDLKIEWDDASIKLPKAPAWKETEIPDRFASFVSKQKLIDKSYGFFGDANVKTPTAVAPTGSEFEDEIMGADISINVQDYILFPTMEELLKEVIPFVFYRKNGRKSIVRVILPEPKVATGDPVYVIDGIATRNSEFFLSIKPIDVLTVKVVKDIDKLARFGLMGKNGIVLVQTRKGDAREPLDDPSKLIEGLTKIVPYKPRDHADGKELRRPDFRSTLHWNPSVKTDASGKGAVEFFCSDDVGKVRIRVDGITTEGKPFSAEHEIEVALAPAKN